MRRIPFTVSGPMPAAAELSVGTDLVATVDRNRPHRFFARADRVRIMTTIMLVGAALAFSGACARASESYSDPWEYRTPGVTVPSSAVKITMPDTDPFEMRVAGAAASASGVKLIMRDTDPFELRAPGVMYGTSSVTLATPGSTPGRAADGSEATIHITN